MGIRIITDSGSDIPQEMAEKWGITVLPLTVRFDGEKFLDGFTLTPDELFSRMDRGGVLPKTGPVPVFAYEVAFARALKADDVVICITLSSGMSECYQNACKAAGRFGDRVFVIDSLSACAGQYVLVRYALGMVKMGKTCEEIVHRLERDRRRLHVISLVDTLKYVHMGGRLSHRSRLIGMALRLKPIITADAEGKVKITDRVRGRKNAFRMFTELVEEVGGIDFSMPVCMAWSGCSDENMRAYMKKEAALFEGMENHVHVMQFGATSGTYSGSGGFAIGFFHRRVASFM